MGGPQLLTRGSPFGRVSVTETTDNKRATKCGAEALVPFVGKKWLK